jgi:hypothetical protein
MQEKYKVFNVDEAEKERVELVCEQLGEDPPWD